MNKMILKIIVISIFFAPLLECARVMSPGVAQAELNRMIRDVKKNKPSSEKVKQLLNDVSPSLRQDYEDALNVIKSKDISEKAKDEEVITFNQAMAVVIEILKRENLSRKDAEPIIRGLKAELGLDDDMFEQAKLLIDEYYKSKERDENKSILEDLFDEEASKSPLNSFLLDLVMHFKENTEEMKDDNLVLPKSYTEFKVNVKDFDFETKKVNQFFKAFKNNGREISELRDSFKDFFEMISVLYNKVKTCNQLKYLYTIMERGDNILHFTKKQRAWNIFSSNPPVTVLSMLGDPSISKMFYEQMTSVEKKIQKLGCNKRPDLDRDLIAFPEEEKTKEDDLIKFN